MKELIYWRNMSRTSFDTGGAGRCRLDEARAAMAENHDSALGAAVNAALKAMPWAALGDESASENPGDGAVQEVFYDGATFRACFVLRGVEQRILGHVVGGGGELWIRAGDRIHGELALYFHRLVCTNGAVMPVLHEKEISAWTIDGWTRAVEDALPELIARLDEEYARMRQAARMRVTEMAQLLPGVAAVPGFAGTRGRQLVAGALAQEPGDTVWHLANAFSAAANILELRSGPPSSEVLVERRALQRAAMKVLRLATGEMSPAEALALH